jgi:heptosyltransferase II
MGAKKILVRAPNWLGDAVMCGPFLKRLAEKEPSAEIHVLARRPLAPLFERAPHAAAVVPFGPDEGFLALAARLRRTGYHAGYVLPPSFSSALLFALARVPERIGHAADFRGPILTLAVRLDERHHYVRRYLGLLGEAGREVGPGDFYFPRPDRKDDEAEAVFAAHGIPPDVPLLAMAPGSRAPARRWPAERFGRLLRALPEKDWPAVLLLGAAEDAAAEAAAALGRRRVFNLCGRTGLIQLGDVLRRSAALVSNESGMMHVAWAVGTPTVVLAGPSEPRLTSPFGMRARVLQRREVPCVPCVRNECHRAGEGYMECLKRIEPEEVLEALRELTGRAPVGR